MWAPAHVHVFLVVVQAHLRFIGHVFHQTQFVRFAALLKNFNHLGTRCHFFNDIVVLGNQLFHPRFNGCHVFRGEGALIRNIVVKTFFNHWANYHLGGRVQLLDGMANQVGTGVADDVHPFLVLGGDDLQRGILRNHVASI